MAMLDCTMATDPVAKILALYEQKLHRLLDRGTAPFGRFTERGRWERTDNESA